MELMSTSLDKFYKYVYCALDNVIPEEILGKITLAVSSVSLFVQLNNLQKLNPFIFPPTDC